MFLCPEANPTERAVGVGHRNLFRFKYSNCGAEALTIPVSRDISRDLLGQSARSSSGVKTDGFWRRGSSLDPVAEVLACCAG